MIDKIEITPRARGELSDAAQALLIASLTPQVIAEGGFACLDVNPKRGDSVPLRPFLHRGDWVDDGLGNLWTVLTALLHEEDGDGGPYLWHEYEVAPGMHRVV